MRGQRSLFLVATALLLCGLDGPPPEPCATLPAEAWSAVQAQYTGRTAETPVTDADGDGHISASEVFRLRPERTRCDAWGSHSVIFVDGGSYQTAALAEAWLWRGSLVRLPLNSKGREVQLEPGTGWLRVVTHEGCCDFRWRQVTWLRPTQDGAEVALSVPLGKAAPSESEITWVDGPGDSGTVRIHYARPTGDSEAVTWSVAGHASGGSLAEALEACARNRALQRCQAGVIQSWSAG